MKDKARSDLMTPRELAGFARVSEATLANWRSVGRGPSYHKAGGAVRYSHSDVMKWLQAGRVALD